MLPMCSSAPFGALDITVAAVISLPSLHGSVAILEHQPQAELKVGNSGNLYDIKQLHGQDIVLRMLCSSAFPFSERTAEPFSVL